MFITILLFVIILAILVLIHEFGHFTAAKLMGIRVEEFGFGLPPRIVGKKIGETIYSLNWLPIGGFVRLYGEDEEHPEKVKTGRSRTFFAKHPWQRAIVLTAGVLMNFLLGWFIFTVLFTQGVQVETTTVRVRSVSPDSPAYQAGIKAGDVIQRIRALKSGKEVVYMIKSPQDLIEDTQKYLDLPMELVFEREGIEYMVTIIPRSKAPNDEGALGVEVSNFEMQYYSLVQTPKMALVHVVDLVKSIVVGVAGIVWKLITFQGLTGDVAGPVRIGKLVGEARRFGILAVLELLGVLSVNLAVINILPFPALDGGRLLFVVIEGITGKKANPVWERSLHQVGMLVLLLLILLITVNDVLKLTSG